MQFKSALIDSKARTTKTKKQRSETKIEQKEFFEKKWTLFSHGFHLNIFRLSFNCSEFNLKFILMIYKFSKCYENIAIELYVSLVELKVDERFCSFISFILM